MPAAAAGALPLFRSKGKKSLDVKKQACVRGGNPPGIPTAAPRGFIFSGGSRSRCRPPRSRNPSRLAGLLPPASSAPHPIFWTFRLLCFLLFFSFFSPSGFYLTHPVGRAPSRGRSRRLPSTPQYAHCLPAHARRAAPGPPFPVPGRTPGPKRAEKEGDTAWGGGGPRSLPVAVPRAPRRGHAWERLGSATCGVCPPPFHPSATSPKLRRRRRPLGAQTERRRRARSRAAPPAPAPAGTGTGERAGAADKAAIVPGEPSGGGPGRGAPSCRRREEREHPAGPAPRVLGGFKRGLGGWLQRNGAPPTPALRGVPGDTQLGSPEGSGWVLGRVLRGGFRPLSPLGALSLSSRRAKYFGEGSQSFG